MQHKRLLLLLQQCGLHWFIVVQNCNILRILVFMATGSLPSFVVNKLPEEDTVVPKHVDWHVI